MRGREGLLVFSRLRCSGLCGCIVCGVAELVETFEKVTGVEVPHKIVGRRAGDIEKIWADTTFANRELGWKATRPIEETLASAWAWEKHLRGMK